ncbi:MAG: PD-(D/E)XK nuclease family protein [Dehalococcoidia bacterium]|nr:PD-(D/E)XK nuclease family protein [Dehalococcoidia bacterium]
MTLERHFLNWDAPLTQKARSFFLPSQPNGPVDMGKDLIIVPTRQAGRRLREALAHGCAEHNTVLLPPLVETPGDFLRRTKAQPNIANKTEVSAIWAHLLMNADLKHLCGLFPARIPEQRLSWALHTGRMIQRLRDALADGGYRIADVHREFDSVLEEPQRWQDLAELETAYFARLSQVGKRDPIELMIEQTSKPELPARIERIIIAAVPDPTPLLIRALENLAKRISIVILIHAPESLADWFDQWGRPIPEKWRDSRIVIPDPQANIILAGSPPSQSQKALHLMAAEKDRFGPADIAIGVPDPSITPHLWAELEDRGLLPFDPAGKPATEHPLFHLLDSFHTLATEGSYQSFSAFLRHADVLERIGLSPHLLLEELDRFQNEHLPSGWKDIADRFSTKTCPPQFDNLEKAVAFTQRLIDDFERIGLDSAVRSLLQMVYEIRTVDPAKPEDGEFIEVAKLIDATLREFESETVSILGLGKRETLALLIQRLGEQRYSLMRKGAVIDLEGWLELPWNDAPFLIVTGMNEEMVPASRLGDIFLPDSLRIQLNLPDDSMRLATDIYILQELIESRKAAGRVSLLAGKTSSAGDPLKPSRLLFYCDDTELPHRAERLFGDAEERRDNHPPTISFRLMVGAGSKPAPTKMSVTQFKDYMACPFRFYMKHILGMEALDDQKTELDAMDFGSLVHHALKQMAQNQRMRRCENASELAGFLSTEAEKWAEERFGKSPPLQIEIQLLAAIQRLSAAARVQAELVGEGWEIHKSEWRVETSLKGMQVSGRIDRVDRHRQTGRIRILDYKTSEKATKPEAVHLLSASKDARDYARVFIAEKEKRWGDLQLPLYRLMLLGDFAGPIEFGYFNLPKAITETGLTIWEDFNDKLMKSSKGCAEGVIEDIQNGRFWPPAAKVQYDDFAALFPAAIEDCVEL